MHTRIDVPPSSLGIEFIGHRVHWAEPSPERIRMMLRLSEDGRVRTRDLGAEEMKGAVMPFDGTDFPQIDALAKIELVRALIADEQRWCKGSLLNLRGQMCLMGAIHSAHAGQLSPVILRAARDVTGSYFPSLERFNDDRNTTHALVLEVLGRARQDIESGRSAPDSGPWHSAVAGCRSLAQRWYLTIRTLL